MSEETNEVTPEAPVTETPQTPEPIDLDQKISVGGEEYSATELAEKVKNYDLMRENVENLEGFREATMRLMNPDTDTEVKKRDARSILLASNYSPQQVDEWLKIYDENPEMTEEQVPSESTPDPLAQEALQNSNRTNEELLRVRAQLLQQNMEKEVSTALDRASDGKVLMDWLSANREGTDLDAAKENLTERVRAQALENLRQRRNHAGSFEDAWVGEEVNKAATKVAKDMLTVIGDTSKIGRVSETAEQTENLYRKDPVKLPDTKGKSFGDVEGQLRDWTSDQLLRSLSDPGGDSKA
tara:strand:- start:612 stop:1505 length:894 start_codon:yes stop_codon:yes gene_type:complete